MTALAFDPLRVFQVLETHRVRYVLIGGLAAVVWGSPLTTGDADICPDAALDNLERLSRALTELDARIHTSEMPEGLPFDRSRHMLSQSRVWNLVTTAGRVDLSFEPSGTQGWADLSRDAVEVELGGALVMVAALGDVIRSKEAAGRDRDLQALPTLRALAERLDEP